MYTYTIEVIHESTGNYMSFQYESDLEEDQVFNEILQDLSVVAMKEIE